MNKQYHELTEKTPIRLDALLENADAPKRVWDLGSTRHIEHVLYAVIAGGFGPEAK